MKSLLIATFLAMFSLTAVSAEKEKVCIEVKDAKTGKVTEQCKMMKKHKKLEGTEVPKK